MTAVEKSGLPELLETITAMRDDVAGPRSLAVLELTMRRGEMSPLHEQEEDEALRVLEGSIVIHASGESVLLGAGDAFLVPRGMPHALGADSDQARYLTATYARSVRFYEDFLRAAAQPDSIVWSEDAAALAAIARVNGIKVFGPPGSLPAAVNGKSQRAEKGIRARMFPSSAGREQSGHVQAAIRVSWLADVDLR